VGTRRLPFIASAEFRLALKCCRNNFSGYRGDSGELTFDEVDWQRFLRLIRFHRIEGLVWSSLSPRASSIPTYAKRELSQAASDIAVQNLQMLAECRSLTAAFRDERIELLFLKGLAVGALAYGNSAVKSAIDIDLLICPADLEPAVGLLRRRGYRHLIPPDTVADTRLSTWHLRSKESVWFNETPSRGQIDLHTRSADNARLLSGIDVHSPSVEVEVSEGLSLATFASDEQFAYLAVHGASSAWFRLKWISDLAALLPSDDPAELERLYARSQELGAGRAAGQALLLADALFGTLARAVELRNALTRDRATRTLFSTALALVAGEPVEPTEKAGGTLPMHWTQFLLMPGLSYKLAELRRQVGRVLADRWV